MPTEDYLLSRRETLVMERNENGGGDDWVEGMEDELFDDFVVLQQPDLTKFNTTEKLNQEKADKN